MGRRGVLLPGTKVYKTQYFPANTESHFFTVVCCRLLLRESTDKQNVIQTTDGHGRVAVWSLWWDGGIGVVWHVSDTFIVFGFK